MADFNILEILLFNIFWIHVIWRLASKMVIAKAAHSSHIMTVWHYEMVLGNKALASFFPPQHGLSGKYAAIPLLLEEETMEPGIKLTITCIKSLQQNIV